MIWEAKDILRIKRIFQQQYVCIYLGEKKKEKKDTEIYASKLYASFFWKDQEYNFISILLFFIFS